MKGVGAMIYSSFFYKRYLSCIAAGYF